MKHYGQKVKILREANGWSRNTLAQKYNKSYATIAKIEQGQTKLLVEDAEIFGEIFEINPSYFFEKIDVLQFSAFKSSSIETLDNNVNVDKTLITNVVHLMEKFTTYFEKKT